MTNKKTQISLGPLLFNWSPEKARDFYFRIADEAPIDVVYIGEVVCSKRQPFHAPYIPDVVTRLQKAGKKVIFSTLALVMNERELQSVKEIAELSDDIMIEANDISAASILAGKPHAIGSFINVYNEGTLKFFEDRGAVKVSLAGELSSNSLKALAKNAKAELEIQAFGRLPLAISARCYHARSHNLHKDSCQYVCEKDLDGLDVNTMDGQAFLAINGTQTMSHSYVNLLNELQLLKDIGINSFRLSPHNVDMVEVASIFRSVADEVIDSNEGMNSLIDIMPDVEFSNGFFYGKTGREQTA